jgi:hypothetical protein
LEDFKKFARRIFRFYPGWVTGIALPSALSAAMSNRFPVAYSLFAVTLLWAESWWFVSDRLLKARDKSRILPKKHRRMASDALFSLMRRQQRRYLWLKWGVALGIAGLVSAGLGATAKWDYEWELAQNFGFLTPAGEPDPPLVCANRSIPKDFIRAYAGGNIYAGPETSTFIPISIGGYKPLQIRKENGGLLISGEIYSTDGDLAHIDKNRGKYRIRL